MVEVVFIRDDLGGCQRQVPSDQDQGVEARQALAEVGAGTFALGCPGIWGLTGLRAQALQVGASRRWSHARLQFVTDN